jgi:hypothetical protein
MVASAGRHIRRAEGDESDMARESTRGREQWPNFQSFAR